MANFFTKLLAPTTNDTEAAQLLAQLLNVKISDTTLKKEIEEHPDHPSLLSISDVLNNYGIENVGIKFDPDKFAKIPCPFITQLKDVQNHEKKYTVVKLVNENGVTFFDPKKHRWAVTTKDDFLSKCSGVALLTEVNDHPGEKDYDKQIKMEKQKKAIQYLTFCSIPALVIILVIFDFIQYGNSIFLPCIFSLLTLCGCGIGALLIWYELDQHNPILKQICGAGKKVNCGAVLQSNASKIAGISWSVIGFSYFTALLLMFLFCGISNILVLYTFAWINTLAVPYIFFSIYYQWRIAKQWCVLCLSVQGILVLQMATCIIGDWHLLIPINSITIVWLLQSVAAFAIPFVATNLLVPALQKSKESKSNYNRLQKLKHNSQIFETLLKKQKKVTENPEGLGITLGNPNATYRLIKVCNPYCGPCAKAHQPIEDLLHNNPDVQIQILFTATNNDGDIKTPPVKHLLAIAEKNNEDIVKHALNDWYSAEVKNYETFGEKYPMNGELERQSDKIESMKIWCEKIPINFTPTFFVAMHASDEPEIEYFQLPEMYSVFDLKYFFSV